MRNHRDSTSWNTRCRRHTTRLLIALVTCGSVAASGLAPASASALTPPAQDPFYSPPGNLARLAPGTILRARQVTVSGSAQSQTAAAYQLMFRTTSATGQPIAAVTTVLVPPSPAHGPRVLATYEPAYDSLTLNCAPSYTLQGGNGGGGSFATLEEGFIANELQQGWDVNVPDYEGLNSEWTVAPLLGRVSLDSVRAAEHFARDGLTQGVGTKVTFNGYSGGSEAADWAAALASRYAPELNIVGVVGGGNFPDFDYTVSQLDGTNWFGIIPGAFEAYSRAFRHFNIDQLLNPAGQAIAAQDGVDAYGCGGATINLAGAYASQYTNFTTTAALAADPLVRRTLNRLSLRYAPYPQVPELLYNSVDDDIAFIRPVDALVKQYCAAGVTVDYDRDAQGGDHVNAIPRYWAATLQYLIGRFAGQPAPDNCASWGSS
jgi:hypothetical protein